MAFGFSAASASWLFDPKLLLSVAFLMLFDFKLLGVVVNVIVAVLALLPVVLTWSYWLQLMIHNSQIETDEPLIVGCLTPVSFPLSDDVRNIVAA